MEQDLKNLDYAITMAVNTLVTALGMHWENVQREQNGLSLAYDEKAFEDLLNDNKCHHNAVIERWNLTI